MIKNKLFNLMFIQMDNLGRNQQKLPRESNISSTSRHELRSLQFSDLFEPTTLSLSNIKLKFILGEMAKKIRFLQPPSQKPQKVSQQWQKQQQGSLPSGQKNPYLFGKQTLTQQLSNRLQMVKPLQMLEGVLLLFYFWTVSVSYVYNVRIFQWLSYVIILLEVVKLIIKIKILWDDQQKQPTYQVDLREDFVLPLMLLFAAASMALRSHIQQELFEYIIGIYQLFCIILEWRRINRCFSFLTYFAEKNKMRKQLRIVQLFGFTLAMAHLFALIMYSMTYLAPHGQKTWIQKADLSGKEWYQLYIYSFYWANTTMVTVGYGDLTPSNYIEAIIVTIVQVVGTAIFGYMINVIGITVDEIQKKNLQFEQYQGTILKLREHYKLSRELCYKMKNDIKKKESEEKQAPLKNNQQRYFLEYIDSSLKEQFVLETNMKVIKKSIFFLTHFTVNFQNEVALKLIRCIYKPEQTISIQENGQRQLVIINNGRVNVYLCKQFHNTEKTKLGREIVLQQNRPTLNIFGFTSLILNRPIKLKAITQQTTVAYILKRSDVLQCIQKSILDFESFNELRQKMNLIKRIQSIQAPSVKDLQLHYIPNIYILLKKIKYQKQQRLKLNRSNRRKKMQVITFKHYQNKTLLIIPHNLSADNDDDDQFIDIQNELHQHQTNNKNNKGKNLPKFTNFMMDQVKIFQNFIKNYNLNSLAMDYERSCMRKSYMKRNKAISKRNSSAKFVKQT